MPVPQWHRAKETMGATSWFLLRRAKARSNRLPVKFNIAAKVGVPAKPQKEYARDLRRDILGPLIDAHIPVVPDGSRQNLLSAFDKRCNYHSAKRVDPEVIAASLKLLDHLAPERWDPLVHDRALFEEWNAQFPDAKRQRHVRAYAHVAELTSKQFSDKQIFVKVEALLKRHDPRWAPRIIYQSSDLHNVVLGPVMWKCTKRMFSAMEFTPGKTSFMGAYAKDSEHLVERIHRHGTKDSVYLESDFSSNDMTQLEDVHLLEMLWLQRFGAPTWITALMHVANKFKATSHKHKVRATVRNQLPTGAQSTTFRNSLWNASIYSCFAMRMGVASDTLLLGDDNLSRIDEACTFKRQALRRAFEHVCRLAGMQVTVKINKHLSECEFLSKHFIPVGSSFVMAPKLGKAIARFNVRATSNEAVPDREYIAGKALSYAYEFRHVPLISHLFLTKYALADIPNPSFDSLGWNARGAFLRHGIDGVISRIESCLTATYDDVTVFYHTRYNLHAFEVKRVVAKVLFGDHHLQQGEFGNLHVDFV